MEFVKIDFNKNQDVSEIIKILNKNHFIAGKMKNEIEELESEKKIKCSTDLKNEASTIVKTDEKTECSNNSFSNEIEYYLGLLNSITSIEDIEKQVIDALPSLKNNNYNNIVLRLKMELLKNIKDINELICEEKANLEIEDLEDLKREVNLEKKKIDIMSNNNIKNDSECDNSLVNNLIFVPTSSGNIRVLEEIEKIDSEYYDGFIGLFDSIKDGTFKNVKRFHSTNNKSSGVSEVKDYKIRVVFDRIGENDYAVITAFVKKSDNDKGYIAPLEHKIKNYMNQCDSIKNNLENSEFRCLNESYTTELYNVLNGEIVDDKSYRRER